MCMKLISLFLKLTLTLNMTTVYALSNDCTKINTDLKAIACNIYYESRGEPFLGKVSTGWVTLNRLNSAEFPATPSAVVKQPGAFQWYKPKKKHVADYQPSWNEAVSIATAITDGRLADPTDGALYFEKCRSRKPQWYREMYGDHCFRERY